MNGSINPPAVTRRWLSPCSTFATALLGLYLSLAWSPAWAANATVPLNMQARKAATEVTLPVNAGKTFTYGIAYSCAAVVGDCEDVVITDVLPAGIEYLSSLFDPTQIVSISESPVGTVKINFNAALKAGDSGELELNVRFKLGETPDGYVATNTATVAGSNVTSGSSNSVAVEAEAPNNWNLDKTYNGSAVLDQPVTYSLTIKPESSLVYLFNPVITDTLPVGAVFVSASYGVTPTTAGVVTWGSTYLCGAANCSISDSKTVQVTVTYPGGTFTQSTIVNNVANIAALYPSGTYGATAGFSDSSTSNHAFVIPLATTSFDKTNPTNPADGQIFSYELTPKNTGNVPLSPFTVTDTLPPYLELISVTTGVYNQDFSGAEVYYKTASGTYSSYTQWTGSTGFDQDDNTTLQASALALGGSYVTGVEWRFGSAPPFMGNTSPIIVTVKLRANPDLAGNNLSGTSIQNAATLAATSPPGPTPPPNITMSPSNSIAAPNPSVTLSKELIKPSGVYLAGDKAFVGKPVEYALGAVNTGNVPLDGLTLVDYLKSVTATADDYLDITSVKSGNFGLNDSLVEVEVCFATAANPTHPTDFANCQTYTTTENKSITTSSTPALPATHLTGVSWTLKSKTANPLEIPHGWSLSGNNRPRIIGTLRTTLYSSGGSTNIVHGNQFTNCATNAWHHTYKGPDTVSGYTGTAPNQEKTATSTPVCQITDVLNPSVVPNAEKVLESTVPAAVPNALLTYRLDVWNTSAATTDMKVFTVTDFLPAALEFVPMSVASSGYTLISGSGTGYNPNSNGINNPTVEVIYDYQGSGRTLLRWKFNSTAGLPANETKKISIQFQAKIKPYTEPGEVGNTLYLSVPSGTTGATEDLACVSAPTTEASVVSNLDGDGNSTDLLCTSNQTFAVVAIAQLASEKWVKGQLDSYYHKVPETGLTVPNGAIDYKMTVTNTGNIAVKDITIIDILPIVGDTGVKDTSARGTAWSPLLTGPIKTPTGVTVEYSLSSNPCRVEVAKSSDIVAGKFPAVCDEPNWTAVLPDDPSTVRSFRLHFGALTLHPKDSLTFDFAMVAPANAPTNGEIAWNSFAYVATRTDANSQLSAEPNKVGIGLMPNQLAMLGDYVWEDTDNDGIQDSGEPGINYVIAQLYKSDGTFLRETATINDADGNPGYYRFTELPAGSYYVKFALPTGYTFTAQGAGTTTSDTGDSDANATTGITDVITLTADQQDWNWDAGLIKSVKVSVGNYVWFDRDPDGAGTGLPDGIQNEATADGVNGVTVKLYKDDGDGTLEPGAGDALQDTKTTANDPFGNSGYYQFANLDPGSYFVCFDLPITATDFTAANAATTDDSKDSDVTDVGSSNYCTHVTALPTGGMQDLTLDAGLLPKTGDFSLGNLVWADSDNDGLYKSYPPFNESGINGVVVNLYLDAGDGAGGTPDSIAQASEFFGTTTTTTLSSETGRYLFSNLPAGDYIVQIAPANFTSGALGTGILYSFSPSAGPSPNKPDPDNDTNNDDNSQDYAPATGVYSLPVTLGPAANSEPTNDGDTDKNSNLSVDFGFIALDFGDAPDTYDTTQAEDGARHALGSGIYLGASVDAESNGVPATSPNDANGDDSAGTDDENGVLFSSFLAGSTAAVTVSASKACYLNAWLDLNKDGDWTDSGEQILTNQSLSAGTNNLTVTVPSTAALELLAGEQWADWSTTSPQTTYARFRCASQTGLAHTGLASDGEVEDYQVTLVSTLARDYGDNPDTGAGTGSGNYQTLNADNGASHNLIANAPYLGSCVDADDGTLQGAATADDTNDGSPEFPASCATADDEDGIVFPTPAFTQGIPAPILVTASKACRLDAWMDFNQNSAFTDTGEQITKNLLLKPGANYITANIPSTATVGTSYSRFRCSTEGNLLSTGPATDGEVEDYPITIAATGMTFDFGDAPDSAPSTSPYGYPTMLAGYAARHVISGPMLGVTVDAEADGKQGATATGDNTSATNDEDGVKIGVASLQDQVLTPGDNYTLAITANGTGTCKLDAWIDFNVDGDWNDGNEQIASSATSSIASGATLNLSVTVPATAANGTAYARFRCSTLGGLSPSGPALDGEVEDYRLYIKHTGNLDYGDAPDSYKTTKQAIPANDGASHVASGPTLGATRDAETDGQPVTAFGDDNNGANRDGADEDGVSFTTTVNSIPTLIQGDPIKATVTVNGGTCYLSAWIDYSGDGYFTGAGERILKDVLTTGTSMTVDLSTGTNQVTVPTSTALGKTYARFRCATRPDIDYFGPAPNGEVEDYLISIYPKASVTATDFGDAPDADTALPEVTAKGNYTTRVSQFGPAHAVLDGKPLLGSCVDSDSGTFGILAQMQNADWDDNNAASGGPNITKPAACSTAGDDEDGVKDNITNVAPNVLVRGNAVSWTVTAGGTGTCKLNAWIDYNQNGVFGDGTDSEKIIDNQDLLSSDTLNLASVTVPAGAAIGTTYARFRCSTLGGDSPVNAAKDGEVEDYKVVIHPNPSENVDYGDAPDTTGVGSSNANGSDVTGTGNYTTLAKQNGAVHIITGPYLGDCVDADSGSLQDGTAVADDSNTGAGQGTCIGNDDEDGVTNLNDVDLMQGAGNSGTPVASITVKASATCHLYGWIDLDRNGVWSNSSPERIINNQSVTGTQTVTFSIPDSTTPGLTFARFRCTSGASDGGQNPTGTASNGEVEDYQVYIQPNPRLTAMDLGDLPDTSTNLGTGDYATLIAISGVVNDGARHIIGTGAPRLGACVDSDTGLSTSAVGSAGNDDSTAAGGVTTPVSIGTSCTNDDEDGVTMPLGLIRNYSGAENQITVTEGGGTACKLNAWMDFDGNGNLGDSGENLWATADTTLNASGSVNTNVAVPSVATVTNLTLNKIIYSRFRCSSAGSDAPTGLAQNGEVEDYSAQVVENPAVFALDYGDAPDTKRGAVVGSPADYQTKANDLGAYHLLDSTVYLGSCVDADNGTQQNIDADSDNTDTAGTVTPTTKHGTCGAGGDEDGVLLPNKIPSNPSGAQATVPVTIVTQGACRLYGWIDFNSNGVWGDVANEQIFDGTGSANLAASPPEHFLSFTTPNGVTDGTVTYARFRCTSTGTDPLAPTGIFASGTIPNGEVEDYKVTIGAIGYDFGDAPYDGTTYKYPVTSAATNGGGRHVATGATLGALRDVETDGQQGVAANGDDTNTSDDEDGVFLHDATPTPLHDTEWLVDTTTAATKQLKVNVSADCKLDAWVDFNANGDWETGEKVVNSQALVSASNPNVISFLIPTDAANSTSYARFRCSAAGGLSPDGAAVDGEVEDYRIYLRRDSQQLDYGDAPHDGTTYSYQTQQANNGASHVATGADAFMGATRDVEDDSVPNVNADGDTADTDDEDGVVFNALLIQDEEIKLTVTGGGATGKSCKLSAWIDFDQSGIFDSGEKIIADAILIQGGTVDTAATTITIENVPSGAKPGVTYARFRCTTQAGIDAFGPAPDGEVEDYKVVIYPNPALTPSDYGDAPDTTGTATPAKGNYNTTKPKDGAVHLISNAADKVRLGSCVDADDGTQGATPTGLATADDTGAAYAPTSPALPYTASGACGASGDEDGVTIPVNLVRGVTVDIPVKGSSQNNSATDTCKLNAWIDYNQDGVFDLVNERIGTADQSVTGNSVAVDVSTAVPANAILGTTYARFRCSSVGGDAPTGLALDGEVEDYAVVIYPKTDTEQTDLGDAPDGTAGTNPGDYTTLNANNGAVHIITGPYLGDCVDADSGSLQDGTAVADDSNTGGAGQGTCIGNDDEDGVTNLNDVDLMQGAGITAPTPQSSLTITATIADCKVNGWIDFNQDGVWDASEKILTDTTTTVTTVGGAQNFNFNIPTTAKTGYTFARFRCTGATGEGGDSPVGPALNGEVEDYRVQIQPNPLLTATDYGDAPDATSGTTAASGVTPGDYQTRAADNGARHILGVTNAPYLGSCVDSDTGDQQGVGATADDTGGAGGLSTPVTVSVGGCTTANDDEDGVTLPTGLIRHSTVSITLKEGGGLTDCKVNGWIDFNRNGVFTDTDEQVLTNATAAKGTNTALNITIPSSATLGNTYARFRCSSSGDDAPTGLANDGEVEDYQVLIMENPADVALDYGDAPDAARGFAVASLPATDADYQTKASDAGAYHSLSDTVFLGSCVDSDDGTQQGTGATTDDTGVPAGGTPTTKGTCTGGDDEDGVVLPTLITASTTTPLNTVILPIQITVPATCKLNAWIDYDRDGEWESSETVFATEQILSVGVNNLNFTVPSSGISNGVSYARFRCSTAGGLTPYGGTANGLAIPDGEVEDYLVTIAGAVNLDYGDAPATYPTLNANTGAYHAINPVGPRLGAAVGADGIDSEANGQPSVGADGDDTTGTPDDENGVTIPTSLYAGVAQTVSVEVSGAACKLDAWIDFNQDNDWDDSGEQIADSVSWSIETKDLSFTVPADAKNGLTYARFRCSTAGNLSPSGGAPDGEIEDYRVAIQAVANSLDYGDAPNVTLGSVGVGNYATQRDNNGASHALVAGAPYLGDCVDADSGTLQNLAADADKATGTGTRGTCANTGDDEDGVTLPAGLVQGATPSISIKAGSVDVSPATNCVVHAWVDFNQNGVFENTTDEYVIQGAGAVSLAPAASTSGLTIAVPAAATLGVSYARFRCSSPTALGGDSPTGPASDGEVEDYQVLIQPSANADFGDASDTGAGTGTTGKYRTTAIDGGASHQVGVLNAPVLGACVDVDSGSLQGVGATADDSSNTSCTNDEDGVVFPYALVSNTTIGNTLKITVTGGTCKLNAWIDFNGNGDFAGSEQIATNQSMTVGTHDLSVAVPASTELALGTTYARFRCSSVGNDTPYGYAADGEVEDYAVIIQPNPIESLDYGDAPDSLSGFASASGTPAGSVAAEYQTRPQDNGAAHLLNVTNAPYLGACADADNGTAQNTLATADDGATAYTGAVNLKVNGTCGANGDEDGVTFVAASLVEGKTANITVTSSSATACKLNAWIDYDQSGTFDAGEQIATNGDMTSGTQALTPTIPATAVLGYTYARFRCSTAGGDTPVGLAADGEVEDYRIQILPDPSLTATDDGDAPDAAAGNGKADYSTTDANNGARHILGVTNAPYLGACVDSDAGTQQDTGATADDTGAAGGSTPTVNMGGCADDEDGVEFVGQWQRTLSGALKVTAAAVGTCKLNAWVDYNQNGVFDSKEQIFTDRALTAGVNNLSVTIPGDASLGETYARFRCSTQGGDLSTGLALDGEVEDHVVTILDAPVELDLGDAPAPYPTLLADDGANHKFKAGVFLGAKVDLERNGAPDDAALGDDTRADDDEDGVTFLQALVPGKPAQIQVTVLQANVCALSAWMDFNADGDWNDADERIFKDTALPALVNTLRLNVPITALPGKTYARFRCTTTLAVQPTGYATDGEVEDYQVTILVPKDFGDLPTSYQTMLAHSGARHLLKAGIYLGKGVDAEADGQSSSTAGGDDNDGNDDEDGVSIPALIPGQSATLTISVPTANACVLSAWMDFEGNGNFSEASNQIAKDMPLPALSNALLVKVPATAKPGSSYARFRCSTQSGLSYRDEAPDGEVEDYPITFSAAEFDLGDAASHPTLAAENGAKHQIIPGIYLGASVDADADGQPNLMAVGDDTNGVDDEDGIRFTFAGGATAVAPNTVLGLEVKVPTANVCLFSAWMDFNGDGDWNDAGEQVFADRTLPALLNTLTVTLPATLPKDLLYLRARCSTQTALAASGAASDGEVEDYALQVAQALVYDFGDAPTGYPTLKADQGASHVIRSGIHLGNEIDAETDGAPSAKADGDDVAVSDDEDGVTFSSDLVPGRAATLVVTVPTANVCLLNAWMDFNGDLDWQDAGEQIFTNQALPALSNTLTLQVPANALPGQTAARFRCSTTPGLSQTGEAADGEVEDYLVNIVPASQLTLDFGDLPDSYATLLASDGARHTLVTGIYLGAGEDAETEGQPNALANGDDLNGAADDEDGVRFLTPLEKGKLAQIEVQIPTPEVCRLQLWMDFNGDGDFADLGEQLFTDHRLVSTINNLGFMVPQNASAGGSYARFRCSTQTGLLPNGAAKDGEVEDYAIQIVGEAYDFGDLPDSYKTQKASSGARHLIKTGVYLGASVDAENDGQASVGADGDDTHEKTDEDGIVGGLGVLSPGGKVTLTIATPAANVCLLQGWMDFNADGDFSDNGEQIFSDVALPTQQTQVSFDVPLTAATGVDTYARLRCSTQAGLGSAGDAPDGEVEDYRVLITPALDYGDAPDSYGTTASNNGASHIIKDGIRLGDEIDPNANVQPSAGADADDSDSRDDEDGVSIGALVPGQAAELTVHVPRAGICLLNAWMDFNRDGDFSDAGEQILLNQSLTSTVNTLRINVPSTASLGDSYARFRCSTQPSLGAVGPAPDGEVEDYAIQLSQTAYDYGDAAGHPTRLSEQGARHILVPGIHLGAQVDSDSDGQPTALADGDDLGSTDDEDGLVFSNGVLFAGTSNSVALRFPAAKVCLFNLWMDFNGDGDWADSGEHLITDLQPNSTELVYNFSAPDALTQAFVYARARCSTQAGLTSTGDAPDGEVEDYRLPVVLALQKDYGDLPDSYGTTTARDGARHTLVSGIHLGNNADAESDGQPSSDALGDDNAGQDDEDGIRFIGDWVRGQPATLQVSVPAPEVCLLQAWMDFNGDGDFADNQEQILLNQRLTAVSNTLSVTLPATAQAGLTAARFRCSTVPNLPAQGDAPDGEVEDYQVRVLDSSLFDYGDAPDSYKTQKASGGARHLIKADIYLGASVDAENEGQASIGADGDDRNAKQDEDGIVAIQGLLSPEGTVTLTIATPVANACLLQGWMDFNADGDFADSGERIFSDAALPSTRTPLSFKIPATAVVDANIYARLRCSTQAGLGSAGDAPDGEVEDYLLRLNPQGDFGDAPDSYQSTLANNGAWHEIVPGVHLGSRLDADADGQPSVGANGDDAQGLADEDGVQLPSDLTRGQTATLQVTVPSVGVCLLQAWMDFNGDGDFADSGEQIFRNQPLPALTNTLTVKIPETAKAGSSYARFRCSTQPDLSYSGKAPNGEVEDYRIEIQNAVLVDYGDAPDSYHSTQANNGAQHSITPDIYLGNSVDAENDGQPRQDAQGDDSVGTADENGIVSGLTDLRPGTKATLVVAVSAPNACLLQGWMDFNSDGDFNDSSEQIFRNQPLPDKLNTLSFSVPAEVETGTYTYARLRCSTQPNLGSSGAAPDGEVEDYSLMFIGIDDFGDAPDSYGTKVGSDGARHTVVAGIHLGTGVDAENDGRPDAAASGDDQAGNSDANGVVAARGNFAPGGTVSVDIAVSQPGACLLQGWIDFNADGDFEDAGEQIFTDVALPQNVNTLEFSVPDTAAVAGVDTYARLRCSTQRGLGSRGPAPDGEVEDYRLVIATKPIGDFGDAPPPYPTSLQDRGAWHALKQGVFLGTGVNPDDPDNPSNSVSGGATVPGGGTTVPGGGTTVPGGGTTVPGGGTTVPGGGTTVPGGTDDFDDGVDLVTDLIPGQPGTINVRVPTPNVCFLNAWIDFNRDGDWNDVGEQIATGMTLAASSGVNALTFNVPQTAQLGGTYARFRCSTEPSLPPTGPAPDGEVEDHLVTLRTGTATGGTGGTATGGTGTVVPPQPPAPIPTLSEWAMLLLSLLLLGIAGGSLRNREILPR